MNVNDGSVLFVLTNSALNRGMNTGLENLAWGLAESGFKVHILTGGSAPDSHGYALPENVHYHFTGVSGENPISFLPRFRSICFEYRIVSVVGWIINTALMAKEECAQEVAFFANLGQMPPRSILLRFLKAALLGKMRFVDAIRLVAAVREYPKVVKTVVSISKAAQDASISVYRVSEAKCRVVPRGIDTEIYAHKERSSVTSNPTEILFAGNIQYAKGVGELVKAMALVDKPLRLRLCGRSESAYIDALKAEIASSGHQMVYMGPQSQTDLVAHYQHCDIFAFPSHGEGLGKALIEAMSCGCPVVCSDISAFQEIVQHGHNGLMVPVRSAEAIAAAIERYINEPTLRKNCSENGRKTIEERFSKQHEIVSWVRILQDIGR